MYHFSALTLSLAITVAALVVPRATPPAGWDTAALEQYNIYHDRYMALGCNLKHNSTFFHQCCHPLLANQTLVEARPAECIPDDGDDDCDGNDDSNDDAATPSIGSGTPTSSTPVPRNLATTQSSDDNEGGFATFFYQGGVAGACGTVHSDDDFVAAIDADRYGDTGAVSGLCGKQVSITNTNNQHTVVVTIADACPTCENSNSIDLSVAAFEQLADLSEGMVPITWTFV